MKPIWRILAAMLVLMLLPATLLLPAFAEEEESENEVAAHWKFQNEPGCFEGSVEDDNLTIIDLTGNGNDLEVRFEGFGDQLDIFRWDEGVTFGADNAYTASSSLRFGNTWDLAKSVDPYDASQTTYTGAYTSGKYFQTVDTAPLNMVDSTKGWTVEVIFKIDAEWNNNYNRYTGIFSRQGLVESLNEPSFSMALTEHITGSPDGYISTDGTVGVQYLHVDANEEITNYEIMNGEIYGEQWYHYMVTSDGTYTEIYINGKLAYAAAKNNELFSTDDFFGWEVGVGRKSGEGQTHMNTVHPEGMIRRLFCGSIAEIRFTMNYLDIENSLYYTNEIGNGNASDDSGEPLLAQNNIYNYWSEEILDGCFMGQNHTAMAYTEEGIKLSGIPGGGADPYVTFNIKKYVDMVNAEELRCEEYPFIVLKVKASGTTGDGQLYCTSHHNDTDMEHFDYEANGEWQYAIVDTRYTAWADEGTPITVRLDWATGYADGVAAEDAYLILGELALFKTEEEAYAHAGEEIPTVPQKTEAPETDAPTTDAPTTEAETEAPAKKGCGSVVGAGAAVMAIITLGALVIGKKKD